MGRRPHAPDGAWRRGCDAGTKLVRLPRHNKIPLKPGLWICPKCGRIFRRPNLSYSCGVGSRKAMLQGKPEHLLKLYRKMEKSLKAFGGVEIVAKRRYALFRTTRIFADLVFMRDALRLAPLLNREVKDPLFFKIQRMSTHRIAHVAKVRTSAELRAVMPDLKEAHLFAQSEHHRN